MAPRNLPEQFVARERSDASRGMSDAAAGWDSRQIGNRLKDSILG
jgi:hypothetical protein